MTPDVFIFAGEKSGDAHGALLMKQLKSLNPLLQIAGVGGPLMRAEGLIPILPMEKFQVMGFIDVIKALPSLIYFFYFVRNAILKLNPKVVFLIDYQEFNLRLAKQLKKQNFKGKVCQYISPSVWAWRKERIFSLEKNVDLLLSILPFEKEFFARAGSLLPVEYVGNPLIEKWENHSYAPLDLPKNQKVIGLFPGSRKKEVERNLPLYISMLKKLQSSFDFHVAVSIAHKDFEPLIKHIINKIGFSSCTFVDSNHTYELMRACHLALAKCGTTILELALHQIPTVVTYPVTAIDLFLAKNIFKISPPYFSLPNLICNKMVFPELIGPYLTPDSLYEKAYQLFSIDSERKKCIENCQNLYTFLQPQEKNKQAADWVMQLLQP